ncbi:cobalamin biosynthesis protein [Treponema sp. TIM-1]|uniref:cobalamin biosynthesis protein n=1 Tax=Treponema sp. TIM-1 TaxID=2898417 RepID=UPI00397FD814
MVFLRGPAAIALGFLLDILLGDPPGIPHPVRGMGFLIDRGESILRRLLPHNERAAGTLLVVLVTSVSLFLSGALLFFAYGQSPWAGFTPIPVILMFRYLIWFPYQFDLLPCFRVFLYRFQLTAAARTVR